MCCAFVSNICSLIIVHERKLFLYDHYHLVYLEQNSLVFSKFVTNVFDIVWFQTGEHWNPFRQALPSTETSIIQSFSSICFSKLQLWGKIKYLKWRFLHYVKVREKNVWIAQKYRSREIVKSRVKYGRVGNPNNSLCYIRFWRIFYVP